MFFNAIVVIAAIVNIAVYPKSTYTHILKFGIGDYVIQALESNFHTLNTDKYIKN